MHARRLAILTLLIPLVATFLGATSASADSASAQGRRVTVLDLDPQNPAASSTGIIEVQLNRAAPRGGSTVTLASSDSSALAVPASVTIPAGSSNNVFTYTTGAVSTVTSVTVTAALGKSSVSAVLTVTPEPVALILSPSTVTGGSSSTGLVTLESPAPAGGTTVTLGSSNTEASVPGSVLVPAGQTTATFQITTQPVQFEIIFDIEATLNGSTAFAALTVNP